LATLAACSSGNDAAPPDMTAVAPTVASTTEATTTTTSAPSTNQAPTTTIDPAAQLAAEVEADFLEAYRSEVEVLMDRSMKRRPVRRSVGGWASPPRPSRPGSPSGGL
jgi:hypothetical protein